MAVETKIGLVVGLAFIVCFGVILQHRGGGDRLSTDVALELLKRQRQSSADRHPERTKDFTRSNPGDGRTISALPNHNVPVERPLTRATSSRRPPATRPPVNRSQPPARRVVPRASSAQPRGVHNGRHAVTKPNVQRRPAGQTKPPAPNPAYETLFGEDDSTKPLPPAKEAKEVQAPKGTKTPQRRAPARHPKPIPKEDRRYVVKPGDTLWGIAEREYGHGSRAVVDALYAANRGQMSSPGALSVGMRLVLPNAGETRRKLQTHRTAGGTPPSRKGATHFYQVKKGDRYTTIAERFLGQKSRWKEVYELNKDIFPDAGRIRPGVRIRLPATVLADAR